MMTISPTYVEPAAGHLLVLTCDAAMRDLEAAASALACDDRAGALARVRTAQRILLELMAALDPAIAPEATDALRALYQHLFDRLSDPDTLSDPARLHNARQTLHRIRDAWARNHALARQGA